MKIFILVLVSLCGARSEATSAPPLTESECESRVNGSSLLYHAEVGSDGCTLICILLIKSLTFESMYFDESDVRDTFQKEGTPCIDQDHVS